MIGFTKSMYGFLVLTFTARQQEIITQNHVKYKAKELSNISSQLINFDSVGRLPFPCARNIFPNFQPIFTQSTRKLVSFTAQSNTQIHNLQFVVAVI